MRRALPIAVAVFSLLLAQGDVESRRRVRPTRRGVGGAVGGVHLFYAWQERVDQIPIQHEIHIYGNGFMRYAQRAGTGPLQETTLPNDLAFVASVIERYRVAHKTKTLLPPCGAPQGGVLTVRLGRRPRTVRLDDPEQWNRYGRLIRTLVARVVGSVPPPLEADCQLLRLRVDPTRLTGRRTVQKLPTRDDERRLLLQLGVASSADRQLERLADLAHIRDGDRFFRWALLRRHPGSLAARRLVRQHASELVRSVRDRAEARELLGTLGQLSGPEGQYHRAVLQMVVGRTEDAARNLAAFHTSLNQLPTARVATERLTKLRAAQVDIRRRRPPWGPIRRSVARQFVFWHRLARSVWAGDPAEAPPLAILLYRRALHFARLSALSPSVRASSGGAAAVRAARSLVRTHFRRLAHGRWDALPYMWQQDLLVTTGYVRRYPTLFPKGWAAQNVDDYTATVCRMIHLRYFAVADRFVDRMVEQRKADEGALRLAQGRCLVERERWAPARRALARAAALGKMEARVVLADALLDQGDLGGAERELAALPKGFAAGLIIESRLWRLRERPVRALRAAQAAVGLKKDALSLGALAQSLELAGRRPLARQAYREAAAEATVAGRSARLALARLELTDGSSRAAFDAVWPLVRAPERRLRAAAHAVLAGAAAGQSMGALALLQTERAIYHAGQDPAALAEVADVLIAQGRRLGVVLDVLRLARGRRPGWSRIYSLYAFVYGQLRRLPRALQSISTALAIRPDYPPYRAIERALVRLRGKAASTPTPQATPKPRPRPQARPKPEPMTKPEPKQMAKPEP